MSLAPNHKEPTLKARIERLEERFAVLRNEQIGEFFWPLTHLPQTISVGDTITLTLETKQAAEDLEYERRRKLLEELIN